jgi:ATP-dependent DNA helicase
LAICCGNERRFPFLITFIAGVEEPTNHGRATEEIVSSSGKMIVLDILLKRLQAKGHRVVLFSQYTQTLDIINDFLDLVNDFSLLNVLNTFLCSYPLQ